MIAKCRDRDERLLETIYVAGITTFVLYFYFSGLNDQMIVETAHFRSNYFLGIERWSKIQPIFLFLIYLMSLPSNYLGRCESLELKEETVEVKKRLFSLFETTEIIPVKEIKLIELRFFRYGPYSIYGGRIINMFKPQKNNLRSLWIEKNDGSRICVDTKYVCHFVGNWQEPSLTENAPKNFENYAIYKIADNISKKLNIKFESRYIVK